MGLNTEGQRPSTLEQFFEPDWRDELLQYNDNELVLRYTGNPGVKFDFQQHKYNPADPGGRGIVSTRSGNEYFIFTRHRTTTGIMNAHESIKRENPVIAFFKYATLPPIEFGKPWKIPGFYTTTDIQSVLIDTNTFAYPQFSGSRKIDEPNPFDKYARLVNKLSRPHTSP